MKQLALLLIIVITFVIPALAQQGKFIIGAEHVSSIGDFWDPASPDLHTNVYWDTVKSLGLNYVGLKYFEQYSGYGNATVDKIRTDISKALSNSINVYLSNGFDRYDNAGDTYYPKRWLYQIENPTNILNGNNVNDFLNVTGGTVRHDDSASTHWNFAPDVSNSAQNFLRLTPGNPPDPPYGIVANYLRVQNLQPDSLNYYIKVKMRLPFAPSFPSVPVVRVSVIMNGISVGRTILASEFTDRNWKEIYDTSYYKKYTGPLRSDPAARDSNVYNFTDKFGTVEMPNYSVKPIIPSTDYDIQIEWYDTWPYNIVVDLDYVAIDDTIAKRLYDGEFNTRVADFASHYGDLVQNLVVWDEPNMENLFPIQRYESILSGASPTKDPFTYWAYRPQKDAYTKRYLHESRMPVLMADLYPIPYHNPFNAAQLFKIPGDAGYTDTLQARLQNAYVGYLPDFISNAQQFNRPFWLSVQACYYALYGDSRLREPSAYEIRAMVNLGVCYGARGINYYQYTSHGPSGAEDILGLLQDNSGSSLPRYTDSYGQPKWQTVKELNQKLTAIGSELLLLTWQEAKSWHNGTSVPTTWSGIVSAIDAKSLAGVSDNTDYVETGHFTNGDTNFVYVVNRRCDANETRNILLSLKHTTKEWRVFIEGTADTSITSDGGVLTKTYTPGEGKLIKILQEGPDIPQNVSVSSYGGDRWHPAHPKLSWSKNIPPPGLLAISGYEIYRSTNQNSPGSLVATTSASDSFIVDNDVNVGSGGLTVYYRVKAKDVTSLHSSYSAQVSIGSSNFQQGNKQATSVPITEKPTEFAFKQNYPNPFNPSTQIAFDLPQDVFVTIKIYNEIGQEVETLINEHKSVGRYSIEWNASNLPSGIYICRIWAGGIIESRKMILMK